MNRTKVVTFTVIILMLALIGGKRLFTRSELEQPAGWEGEVDTVSLSGKGETVTLVKKGEEWFIDGTEWKASARLVNTMTTKMQTLVLFDKITESKQYARYELDDDSAVLVTIQNAGETLRKIYVGKQSPGVNQTYVRFPGDGAVYLAGNFGTHDFAKSVSELRDKTIASLPESAIESCTMAFNADSYTLVKKEEKEKDAEGNETKTSVWYQKDAEGTDLDQQKVKSLLGQLQMMQAEGFTSASAVEDDADPYLMIEAAAFDTTVTITMYESGEDELVVKSSERPDYFLIPRSKADPLIKTPDDLLPSAAD